MSGILGAALGVGSSLISAAMNQSNFYDQLDFAKWQYKDMARRQDPVHQVQRLRAAGINPALAYGNVSLGQASSSSVPSANPIQPLDMGGLSSMANSIDLNAAQAANLQSQTQKNQVQTEGERTDNLFRAENWKSLIYGRDAQSWLHDQLSDAAKLDVQFQTESLKYRVEQQRYQMALLQAQTAAQDLVNFYLPSKLPAEVNNLISQQFANYATGKSSLQNSHANLMEIYSKYGGTKEHRNQFFKATLDNLVQSRNESVSREYGNITRGLREIPWTDYHEYNKFRARYNKNR